MTGGEAELSVQDLSVAYGRGTVRIVEAVSFSVAPGETLGLVGESGSGKTTIGRALLRLLPADALLGGRVHYGGQDLSRLSGREMRAMRQHLQMIFQDPVSSFNPRRTVQDIVAEGLEIHGVPRAERAPRIERAFAEVGLSLGQVSGRRAHQFSGGQCQRIAIARALAVEPQLIVCDEPVASLDVSVQAHVMNLLREIQQRRALSLIFISHDLAVVRNISDRVAVLYLGRLVEIGPADVIFRSPAHPYTRMLLDAVPAPVPSGPVSLPPPREATTETPIRAREVTGCAFRERCGRAATLCATIIPPLRGMPAGQQARCHFPIAPSSPA